MALRRFKVLVGWDGKEYVTFVPAVQYISTHSSEREAAIASAKVAAATHLQGLKFSGLPHEPDFDKESSPVPDYARFAKETVLVEVELP